MSSGVENLNGIATRKGIEMTNWKTTVSGLLSSGAALVLALVGGGVAIPHWLQITAGFVLAGGLATLGIGAKDNNVTGGTKQQ